MSNLTVQDNHDADTDPLSWRDLRQPYRSRRRGQPLAEVLFAGGSAAVFVVLAGCVLTAVVFYYQSH